jgi:uncharacterized membrane protein YhaH (DUF805 family)
MSVVQERCPACSAPLPLVQASIHRFQCDYCGSPLSVERQGSNLTIALAERVLGSLEQSEAMTQAEFRRLRLTQELSAAEMRLANVQSEIRSIQRGPVNAVSRTHLNELSEEQNALQKQIAHLKAQLYPNAAPAAAVQKAAIRPFTVQRLWWLIFTFEGRATRSEFWIGAGIAFIIFLSFITLSTFTQNLPVDVSWIAAAARMILNPILFVQMVFCVLVTTAVCVKRFHDHDKSGWWMFIAFIPVIGLLWFLFELGIQPGTPGPNRYG